MTWGSTVPTAVAAIVADWTTALIGVSVTNGPAVADDSAVEAVSVGYQDADTPAVEGGFEPDGFTTTPMLERYTINCLLTVRDGDGDQLAAQTRAFTLIGLMGGALAADPSLGDRVLHAHLGTWELTQTQTNLGATARVSFGVTVDAYTTT